MPLNIRTIFLPLTFRLVLGKGRRQCATRYQQPLTKPGHIIILAILSSLLALSCGDKRNETHMDEDLRKSIEDFKNRQIHSKLTSAIIKSTADSNLTLLVFDNISSKLSDNYEKEFETVLKLSKPRQAFYIIWLVESEVNNGGFNQFYYNSCGQFSKLAPESFVLMGATKFGDLMTRANKIYEKENSKITKHLDGTIEGFSKSYDDNPLNPLDDEFYELYKTENLSQLQIDFIKSNIKDFIDE
jgi:hypothetical protein